MIQWYLTGPRSKSAYAFTSADGLQCRCTRRVSKGSCTCEAPRVGGQSRDQNVEAERTVARYACSYRLDAADTSVTTHTPTDERWSRQCWRTPGGTLNTDIDLSIPCLSIPCLACSPQCRIRRSLIRNHDSTAMTRLVSCRHEHNASSSLYLHVLLMARPGTSQVGIRPRPDRHLSIAVLTRRTTDIPFW